MIKRTGSNRNAEPVYQNKKPIQVFNKLETGLNVDETDLEFELFLFRFINDLNPLSTFGDSDA